MTDVPATDVPAEKRAARAEARRRRDLAAADAPGAARSVMERVLSGVPVPAGAVVSGYWPIGSELDVLPLLRHFCDAGHVCALPVGEGRGRPLRFRAWRPGTAMVEAEYGIMVPAPEEPWVTPSVLLVPLLAFDRAGYRLGYGAGYYDRTLAALRAAHPVLAVGVAMAAQEMDAVPRDRYDQKLDWIVTDRFALHTGPQA
ncbi:5-formyltetrahydrofolate cyclo-ligase [Arenibaculum sp.]|uniref:5-formyltetrahydrofolate cyclo-ligase n=1 Tax=Arenibaculum sp. TaxID=2865862 RepID=UPI002E117CA2|nr:5-formyltetrahydrofolate cyclo-ligase [Arenibaculum sp.]